MSIFADGDERQRLALLYFLKAVSTELTNDQLCKVFEENGWGDYFSLQVAIDDLWENRLLGKKQLLNGLSYYITEKGGSTLKEFCKRLPNSLRMQIDAFAKANRQEFLDSHQNIASFEKVGENEYMVNCRIIENGREIFSLRLNVVSVALAQKAVARWVNAAPGAYENAVALLLAD